MTAYFYDWVLPSGERLPIVHEDLARAQAAVREMIGGAVRDALPGRALDLACNEGWWSHRLREWGATSVVAVDAREENVARARDLGARMGLDGVDFRAGDATRFDDPYGFDAVLCLGLLYHLEDPLGMLRRCRALVRPGGVLALETQVARSPGPVAHAWGSTDDAAERAEGVFAVRWERDEAFPLASVGGVVSLIPDRAALLLGLRAAGFADVAVAEPPEGAPSGFRSGDRLVVLAR